MGFVRFVRWSLLLCAGGLSPGCGEGPLPAPPSEPVRKPRPAAEERPPVEVTPRAAGAVRGILAEQGMTGVRYLRLRVVPGGCCGFQHKLDLDPVATAEDHVFESGGVRVVVFRRQLDMLRGSRVDYGREGDRLGFKVTNPNFEGDAAKKWLPVLEKEKDRT